MACLTTLSGLSMGAILYVSWWKQVLAHCSRVMHPEGETFHATHLKSVHELHEIASQPMPARWLDARTGRRTHNTGHWQPKRQRGGQKFPF